MEMDNYPEDTE
jgi:MOSC domain-containing protein YiiM